jgi:Calcineurin-like phosphoesterase
MSFALGTHEAASAADIWNLVDLGDNCDRNYQAYVDFIAFFTRIRTFCTSSGKPAFVVAGNHDCYKNNKLYGISPRVLWKKANEGVPADHNLTFYEAMLVFGETWGKVFGTAAPCRATTRTTNSDHGAVTAPRAPWSKSATTAM